MWVRKKGTVAIIVQSFSRQETLNLRSAAPSSSPNAQQAA